MAQVYAVTCFISRLLWATRIQRMTGATHSVTRAFEVFRTFLKLGLTSFGGPVAHLGYFREEFVAKKRWISERHFAELLALCQFLPGPTSSQLGFAIGLTRAGYLGALLAWLAFTLPSALLLMFVAASTEMFAGPIGAGVLSALHAVAVAVVAHAIWGMSRTLTPNLRRMLIATVAAVLALLIPGAIGQVSAILVGLGAGLVCCRTLAVTDMLPARGLAVVSKRVALGCLAAFAALLTLLPIIAAATDSPLVRMADATSRAGALVFGGGHVMLPLLQAEPAIAASVTPEQFFAGYSAAQAVPGPLFTFAAYLGEVAQPGGGPAMAFVALIAVFLPGMLLLLGVLPFWTRLQQLPGAAAALSGVNAAVVGLLLAALCDPLIRTGVTSVSTLCLAAGCLVLLFLRVPAWGVVLLGGVVGAVAGASGLAGFGS